MIIASGKNIFLYDLKTKQQESFLDINVWSLKELSNGDVACGLGNGNLYIITVTDELLIKTKFPQGHKKTINCIIYNRSISSFRCNSFIFILLQFIYLII